MHTTIFSRTRSQFVHALLLVAMLALGLFVQPAGAQNINPSTQLRFQAPPIAYSPVFTGTTATGAWQGTTGPGLAGQLLISAGPGAYPIWSNTVGLATSFACGSVTAPGIYQGTNTGTGLYCIAANNTGFAVNGVKLLDIQSARLDVLGAISTSNDLNVGTLDTVGGLTQSIFQRANATSSGFNFSFRKARGTGAVPALVSVGDVAGNILFQVYNDAYRTVANISATAATGLGASGADTPGNLSFWTTPDGTSTQTEKLRIVPAGDIGILAAAKLYLDGVAASGDTYITESSANVLDAYAGGANTLRLTATAATVTGNVLTTGSFDRSSAATLTLGGTATSLTVGAATITPAATGVRFLCISTAGVVTSQAAACVGT